MSLFALGLILSSAAHATGVDCYGEDNLSVELNADRSKMQAVIEGEGRGWAKVTQQHGAADGATVYVSNKGLLILNKSGRSGRFYFPGDKESNTVTCTAKR